MHFGHNGHMRFVPTYHLTRNLVLGFKDRAKGAFTQLLHDNKVIHRARGREAVEAGEIVVWRDGRGGQGI